MPTFLRLSLAAVHLQHSSSRAFAFLTNSAPPSTSAALPKHLPFSLLDLLLPPPKPRALPTCTSSSQTRQSSRKQTKRDRNVLKRCARFQPSCSCYCAVVLSAIVALLTAAPFSHSSFYPSLLLLEADMPAVLDPLRIAGGRKAGGAGLPAMRSRHIAQEASIGCCLQCRVSLHLARPRPTTSFQTCVESTRRSRNTFLGTGRLLGILRHVCRSYYMTALCRPS